MIDYLIANKDWIFSGIGVVVIFTLLPGAIKRIWPRISKGKAPATPERMERDKARDRDNRQAMLEKVQTFWVKGMLDKSLYTEVLIDLGLEEKLDLVELPFNVQIPGQSNNTLNPGTKVIDVFDTMGQALLILGAPGSGKTTMLLELARDLIGRAKQDDKLPIPVVFNLSSWMNPEQLIADWLIDELKTKYNVPSKAGRYWVENEALLLLLDGLDEVAIERREDCVKAINTFRRTQGLTQQIVVCSRIKDYEILDSRLNLQGAVFLQPLTSQQIDDYLNGLEKPTPDDRERIAAQLDTFTNEALRAFCYDNPHFKAVYDQFGQTTSKADVIQLLVDYATQKDLLHTLPNQDTPKPPPPTELLAIRRTLERDTTLQELATSPLMLGIIVLAYKGKSVADLRPLDTVESRQKHLFDGYINAMFERRTDTLTYPKEETIHWLSWLGWQMEDKGQAIFALENMQPDWLPPKDTKRFRLLFGLLGGLSSGLFFGLLFGLIGGLFFGLLFGLLGGLSFGLSSGLSSGLSDIKPIEVIEWSWEKFRKEGLFFGLFGGLFFGLFFGLLFGLFGGLSFGLLGGLSFGLLGGLIPGLIFGLFGKETVEQRTSPNQGIKQSAKSVVRVGLFVGPFVGLLFGLSFGLFGGPFVGLFGGLSSGPFGGLFFGLLGGLFFGLSYGGEAVIKHYLLRFMFYRKGYTPWTKNYVPFLDYTADRIFLRKVGGSYVFIHRLLLEHFAAKWDAHPGQTRPERDSRK